MKTLKFMLVLSLLAFQACNTSQKLISSYHGSFYAVDALVGDDTAMLTMLAPYQEQEQKEMDRIVCYTQAPLSKTQPESTMGNLIIEAQLQAAKNYDSTVQISVSNYGAMRIPYVNPGAITRGMVYQMMPFDNKLVIIEISGEKLQQLCDVIASRGGWPISGVSFQIKDKKAEHVFADGQALQAQQLYKTVTSSYIAEGGDLCDFLKDCPKKTFNVLVRDTIFDYLNKLHQEGKALNITLQNNITYAD
jgi:2',3'-cyclic-nucleotide 2'-phosphodiesterase (5'-nucleotidase family)